MMDLNAHGAALTRPTTDHAPGARAGLGLSLVTCAMAGAGLAGAIAGGASAVINHPLLPTWAADRGLGSLLATVAVVGLSALAGCGGYRLWRGGTPDR